MIKRQFYAIEHADNGDDASSSSSSSSSSSLNTSSDLSSAAEDEQDDGAWPGTIEAMTVSVSFLQSLVCVCVCVAQEACLLKEFFYGGELVVEGLEMLTRVFFGGRFVFDVSEMLAKVFSVEDFLLRSWMVVFFGKENPLLLPLAVEESFVCDVATASSHESDESSREEEGEEAGSGAQLAPLHALLVPYLQFFCCILTEHDHL